MHVPVGMDDVRRRRRRCNCDSLCWPTTIARLHRQVPQARQNDEYRDQQLVDGGAVHRQGACR